MSTTEKGLIAAGILQGPNEGSKLIPLPIKRRSWWSWFPRFPFVSLKRFLRAQLEAFDLKNEVLQQRSTIGQLVSERAYNQRLEAEAKAQLGALRDHCNQVELENRTLKAKQRDLEDPPITREELTAQIKRLSFHQVRGDALSAELEATKARLEEATEKLKQHAPAAQSLIGG
jgi:hypothetical protein